MGGGEAVGSAHVSDMVDEETYCEEVLNSLRTSRPSCTRWRAWLYDGRAWEGGTEGGREGGRERGREGRGREGKGGRERGREGGMEEGGREGGRDKSDHLFRERSPPTTYQSFLSHSSEAQPEHRTGLD